MTGTNCKGFIEVKGRKTLCPSETMWIQGEFKDAQCHEAFSKIEIFAKRKGEKVEDIWLSSDNMGIVSTPQSALGDLIRI